MNRRATEYACETMGASSRPRRSTAARDPERTRQALLDAALVEFSEKGLAGARVSAIAARAGVNKQLISYHFDGKQGLYDALVARWLEREQEFADPALPLAELVGRYVRATVEERDMARLFVRVCVEDAAGSAAPPAGGDDGKGSVAPAAPLSAAPPAGGDDEESPEVADLRRRQAAGELDPRLDPGFLMLALQGAVSAGLTFPGDARLFCGLDPASEEFAARYGEQIELLVGLLAPRDQA